MSPLVRYLVALSVVVVACQAGETPASTMIFDEPVHPLPGDATVHEVELTLGAAEPARVALAVAVVEVDGAAHITNIQGVVSDAGGWEVSFVSKGQPTNVGTVEAPVMQVPILLQQRRSSACGEQLAQHAVRVRADGTAEIEE